MDGVQYARSINLPIQCPSCKGPLRIEIKGTLRPDKVARVAVCGACVTRMFSQMDLAEPIPNQMSGKMNMNCGLCHTDTDKLFCSPCSKHWGKMVCEDCYQANKMY